MTGVHGDHLCEEFRVQRRVQFGGKDFGETRTRNRLTRTSIWEIRSDSDHQAKIGLAVDWNSETTFTGSDSFTDYLSPASCTVPLFGTDLSVVGSSSATEVLDVGVSSYIGWLWHPRETWNHWHLKYYRARPIQTAAIPLARLLLHDITPDARGWLCFQLVRSFFRFHPGNEGWINGGAKFVRC